MQPRSDQTKINNLPIMMPRFKFRQRVALPDNPNDNTFGNTKITTPCNNDTREFFINNHSTNKMSRTENKPQKSLLSCDNTNTRRCLGFARKCLPSHLWWSLVLVSLSDHDHGHNNNTGVFLLLSRRSDLLQ